jgi:hypothetical protein
MHRTRIESGYERLFPHVTTNARSMSIARLEQMFAFGAGTEYREMAWMPARDGIQK